MLWEQEITYRAYVGGYAFLVYAYGFADEILWGWVVEENHHRESEIDRNSGFKTREDAQQDAHRWLDEHSG